MAFINKFTFAPPPWMPEYDQETVDRIALEDFNNYAGKKFENPDFELKIVPDVPLYFAVDLLNRIIVSDRENKKLVLILPSPENAVYISVVESLNKFRISCRNVHVFFLYEYANEKGEVAPWESPYSRSGHFMRYFYDRLNPELRMPMEQIHFWTKDNVESYSDMIAAEGGADLIISATGWVGHTAFIDPDTKKFKADTLEEFMQIKAGFVDNHRLTIIQNSGGDIYHTPAYSVSIGPWDVVHAREHLERHDLGPLGGYSSWERMISRLQLYGPVCKEVPASLYQLTPGTIYVSEDMARPIEPLDLIAY